MPRAIESPHIELPAEYREALEDIHYYLYVRAKGERGIKAVDEGRFVRQDEAEALRRAGAPTPI